LNQIAGQTSVPAFFFAARSRLPMDAMTHAAAAHADQPDHAPRRRARWRHASALLLLQCLLLLPLAVGARPAATAPVEGQDYVVIPGGQRWSSADDRIEVAEIFAYTCHHCADFQPALDAWKRKQPADVRVSYVPAAFSPQDNYGRACFAAQQLGALDRLHGPLFRAIHTAQTVPMSHASVDELAAFAGGEGLDAAGFRAAMASPAVDAMMQRAREFAIASGLRGTPTLVVNGKYRVQAPNHEQALRIAGQLVAMERAARKRP
jgi:protein dithiol oxidoreductase (disulfide-forming)